MLMRMSVAIIGLFGLTACAQTENTCQYKTQEGYAHVVSVPSQAIVSIGVKYQNVKLDPAQFPEEPKPAQVYKIEVGELISGDCNATVFKVLERVK